MQLFQKNSYLFQVQTKVAACVCSKQKNKLDSYKIHLFIPHSPLGEMPQMVTSPGVAHGF